MNRGSTRTIAADDQTRGARELELDRQKRLGYERHAPPCEPLHTPPYEMTPRICPRCGAEFKAVEYRHGYVLCPRCERERRGRLRTDGQHEGRDTEAATLAPR